MRPYVSPPRIALLVLLDMYCTEKVLPEDDDYVLGLLTSFFADSHAQPTTRQQREAARWQRARRSVDLLARADSLRAPLQCCVSVQAATATALQLPMVATLWDDLVAGLWMRLTCLDDLEPFFEGLCQIVAPTYSELRFRREMGYEDPPATTVLLDRRTTLGQLVYQSYVEFLRLNFSSRCRLWEDYVRYRSPTHTDFKILWPHHYNTDAVRVDAVLADNRDLWGGQADELGRVAFDRMLKDERVPASSDETEKLISILIDRERSGFRPDLYLRNAADDVIAGSTLVPAQTTYYRLMDAWRMGDVNTAYDQLHRYFDLVARQGVGAAFGYNMGPMNKAIIQRDFGEHPDDLLSMLDAVHAGRESRDYNSLRFALLWLYMYARMLPRHIRPHQLQGLSGQPADGHQVLPYVRHDAQLANAHAHRAMAYILDGRVALADGRTPLQAAVRLRQGARLVVVHHELTLLGQLMSTSLLLWENMGVGILGATHARAFLAACRHIVPFDDAVRMASRLALLLARAGDYAGAKTALLALDPQGMTSLRPQSSVRHILALVAALQAVRAHHFDDADDIFLRRLPPGALFRSPATAATARPRGPSHLDADLAAHVALLHAQSLARGGRLSLSDALSESPHSPLAAARQALDVFEASYDAGVGDLHVLLRLTLARLALHVQAGRGLRVLSRVLAAVRACRERRYHLLLWEALALLARVLLEKGAFRGAAALYEAVLPRVLLARDVELSATLYAALVDAHMGLAGQQPAGRAKYRQRHLGRAWWYLGRADDKFRQAGGGEAVAEEMALKRQLILAAGRHG